VLLDRHPLWLEAVETILADMNFNVRACASTPEEALTLIDRHEPVLFMAEVEGADGDIDGFACIRRARERLPEMRIVVLSASEDPRRIRSALLAGATVYVMKSAQRDDLQSAVRQAFTHSVYLATDLVNAHSAADATRTRDPRTARGGALERAAREGALGHGTDDQVPPLERLQETGRLEPHRGGSLGVDQRRNQAGARRAGEGGLRGRAAGAVVGNGFLTGLRRCGLRRGGF